MSVVTVSLEPEDQQLACLALAELALRCPGFDHALGQLADRFGGRPLFNTFKALRRDITRPQSEDPL